MVRDLRDSCPGAAMEAKRAEDSRFMSGRAAAVGNPTRIR